MIEKVGTFRNERLAVAADRGDHRFDRFLSELLGGLLHAAGEKLRRPRAGIARATPRDDDPFQIGQRELTRELTRNFAHERPFIAPGRRSPAASAGRLSTYTPLPRR